PHAELAEDVPELVDLAPELEVRPRRSIPRLSFPDQRRLVAMRAARVPIDAVHGRVQPAADEPPRVRAFAFESLVPRAHPLELARVRFPEGDRVRFRAAIDLVVPDPRVRDEIGGRRKSPCLFEQVLEIRGGFE